MSGNDGNGRGEVEGRMGWECGSHRGRSDVTVKSVERGVVGQVCGVVERRPGAAGGGGGWAA
jgi:hypothetical protein